MYLQEKLKGQEDPNNHPLEVQGFLKDTKGQ